MGTYDNIIETTPGTIYRKKHFGHAMIVGMGDVLFKGCTFLSCVNDSHGTVVFSNCTIGAVHVVTMTVRQQ